jgi:hypothetical protein
MSYSRWSDSIWYTYNGTSLTETKRADAYFVICGVATFTYKELTTNLDQCLAKAEQEQMKVWTYDEFGEFEIDESLRPTKEEMEELKGYMMKFIEDCQKDKSLK